MVDFLPFVSARSGTVTVLLEKRLYEATGVAIPHPLRSGNSPEGIRATEPFNAESKRYMGWHRVERALTRLSTEIAIVRRQGYREREQEHAG